MQNEASSELTCDKHASHSEMFPSSIFSAPSKICFVVVTYIEDTNIKGVAALDGYCVHPIDNGDLYDLYVISTMASWIILVLFKCLLR